MNSKIWLFSFKYYVANSIEHATKLVISNEEINSFDATILLKKILKLQEVDYDKNSIRSETLYLPK